MAFERLVYPFSAIVGQENLKLALILNAINPKIGGVIVTGAKGTGKSTTVRALADLLPETTVVDGCPFNCSPTDLTNMCEKCRLRLQQEGTLPETKTKMRIIQLPLSATEDRLIGSLSTEKALREGFRALQPGLLADANQNILYIDEVNLLPDHLTHAILDPAASGWNVIQRESISLTHPSRFILVGSMNPEEGELRPQILDRFALHVKAETLQTLSQRTEIMLRNALFEEDPVALCKEYESKQESLRQKIETAQKLLSNVHTPEPLFDSVAKICAELQVDGHRPDIVTIKAAEALAAFNGRTEVTPENILTVSELTLSHRTKKTGLEASVPAESIQGGLRRAFTELRVALPPTSERVKLPDLGPKQIEDALKFFGKGPNVKKRFFRRRPRRGGFFNVLYLLLTPLIILLTCYFFAAIILMLYFMLFNLPEKISSAFSLRRTLPLMALTGSIELMIFFFLRKRKTSVLFFYEPRSGRLPRRVVSHHISSEKGSERAPEEQYIALHGTYIRRIYKTIMGYGQKIFRSFKHSSEQLSIPLERDIKRRRYHLIGRHTKSITTSHRGRYVWYEFPKKRPWDIAIAPTIRAAAPYQLNRDPKNLLIKIEPQDIRVKVREARTPLTIILLIDMSESMTTSLNNVRNAVLDLHKNAYSRRDRLGLVVFKGSEAQILQYPTSNLNLVVRKLLQVGASDYTPLAAGILKSWHLLRIEKYRNKDIIPLLIIISDGNTNVPLNRPLSPFTRKRYVNPSQADVIDSAYLLAKDQIQTIILNTNHRPEEHWSKTDIQRLGWFTPIDLLLEATRIVGGRYYGFSEKGQIQRVVLTEAITTTDFK